VTLVVVDVESPLESVTVIVTGTVPDVEYVFEAVMVMGLPAQLALVETPPWVICIVDSVAEPPDCTVADTVAFGFEMPTRFTPVVLVVVASAIEVDAIDGANDVPMVSVWLLEFVPIDVLPEYVVTVNVQVAVLELAGTAASMFESTSLIVKLYVNDVLELVIPDIVFMVVDPTFITSV